MKNKKNNFKKIVLLLGFIFTVTTSCEREISDEVAFATFSNNPEVFIDGFSSGLEYFPFDTSIFDAFTVSTDVKFDGTAAMRFDVPSFGVGFAGAIFRIGREDEDSAGRDLTSYDALTFYAKATQGATINEIGFGQDFLDAKFLTVLDGLSISTNWVKYTIPIPDASKLVNERGMLIYAEGAEFAGDEGGYTFWIDELKFEKLGTIAQPRPAILNGTDIVEQGFVGGSINLVGLTQTLNVAGTDITVNAAPSYFDFTSSDIEVARVSELGVVSVLGSGNAIITASIAGVAAKGSLEITSSGGLVAAPEPTLPQANVKSIFSDAYVNDTESNFSPGFGGSSTETTTVMSNGDSFLSYVNNNFTGIIFDNIVDATNLSFLHVDVYVQEVGIEVGIQIRDIGANQILETDVLNGLPIEDDRDFRMDLTGLTVGEWTSFDIPLDGNIATQKDNLGAIILTGGPNFLFDNIYFYTE